PNRLNVVRNDNTSWDYTKPFLLHRDLVHSESRRPLTVELSQTTSANQTLAPFTLAGLP
ncbi:heterogeneous nuclear ribonucleoprotein L-like isoform X1, partial [Lates japonicus]